MANSNPGNAAQTTDDPKPDLEALKAELDEVSPDVPTIEAVPEKDTECLYYDGGKSDTFIINDTQFREAGVKKGFAHEKQTEAVFNKLNGRLVPVSVFTEAAVKKLLKEGDFTKVKSPGPK